MKLNTHIFKSFMNRRCLLIALSGFSITFHNVMCQTPITIELSAPLTVNTEAVAVNSVSLVAGFSSNGFTFTATVLPNFYQKPVLDNSKNYIHTIVPRTEISQTQLNYLYDANSTNDPVLNTRDISDEITYLDGLGRFDQGISVKSGPSKEDVVSFAEYDDLGRQLKNYLAFNSVQLDGEGNVAPGKYVEYPVNRQNTFYQENILYPGPYDIQAYTQTVTDNSPLQRVKESGGIGIYWQPGRGHTSKSNFTINTSVIDYKYLSNPNVSTVDAMKLAITDQKGINGYQPGAIIISESFGPNSSEAESGGHVRVYADNTGKVIKQEVIKDNAGTVLTTHYIYDQYGQLRCKVPPLATGPGDVDLCYYYFYDNKHRLSASKVPGAYITYFVYDQRDRLVATQNGEQRNSNVWAFIKYDIFNRAILSGTYTNTNDQAAMQAEVDAYIKTGTTPYAYYETRDAAGALGYTNNSWPNISAESNFISASYFDNYTFPGAIAFDAAAADFLSAGDLSARTKGRTTGSKTRIVNPASGMPDWLVSVVFYDNDGRVIQTAAQNHLGGTDRTSMDYNYAGEVLATVTKHDGPADVNVRQEFIYDHRGRVLEEYNQVNSNGKVKVAAYEYNSLGQLKTKYQHMVGGEGPGGALQKTDYRYNLQGRLIQINDPSNLGTDVFAENIAFEDRSHFSSTNLIFTPNYNGNVSAVEWRARDNSGVKALRAYSYGFDDLNQLTSADFFENNATTSKFDMPAISYDANGNILSLSRKDASGIDFDVLSYTYKSSRSNQLAMVTDAVNSTIGFKGTGIDDAYDYDDNGNLTKDLNKGISSISYDNRMAIMPQTLTYNDGDTKVNYIYQATGAKLRSVMHELTISGIVDTRIDYVGSFVYHNGVLSYINTGFGRITYTSGSFDYEYYATDHLGNVRAVFREASGNVDVVQITDFYPYGMAFSENGMPNNDNPNLYSGQELQQKYMSQHDLQWYDYGMRNFDPVLGRWFNIDPALQYSSPYLGIGNNPVSMVDYLGMSSGYYDGEYYFDPRENPDGYNDNTGGYNPGSFMWNIYQTDIWASSVRGDYSSAQSAWERQNGTSAEIGINVYELRTEVYTEPNGKGALISSHVDGYEIDWWFNYTEGWADQNGNIYTVGMSAGGTISSNIIPSELMTKYNATDYGTLPLSYEPSSWDRWGASNNILDKLTYSLADGIAVTLQSFFGGPNSHHLNGDLVQGSDRTDAFVNTTSWALLFIKGPTATPEMTAPESIANVTKIGADKASISVKGSASEFYRSLYPSWNGEMYVVNSSYSRTSFKTINGGLVEFQSTSSSTFLPTVKIWSHEGYQLIFRFTEF